MRKITAFLLLALGLSSGGYTRQPAAAQPAPQTQADSLTAPSFQGGGFDEFRQWVVSQAYPKAKPDGPYKKASYSFIIGRMGEVRKVMLLHANDGKFGENIRRTLSQSPQWIPAYNGSRLTEAHIMMSFWTGACPGEEPVSVTCDINDWEPPKTGSPDLPDVDQMPEFVNGGQRGFTQWIVRQMTAAQRLKYYGDVRVDVKCVIQADGSVSNVEIVSANHSEVAARLLKVLPKCPKWRPGIKDGVPVPVPFSFPVIIVPHS